MQTLEASTSEKKRKKSFYDEYGFKTDEFSYHLIDHLGGQKESKALEQKWNSIIPQIKHLKQEKDQKQLKDYVREGIPDGLRTVVWPLLIFDPVEPYSKFAGLKSDSYKQIDLDLGRTFPNNKKVKELSEKMKRVLNAIANAIPKLGYCQGMNFISAIILLKLEEEQTYNVVYHVFHWEKHEKLLTNLEEIHRKMYCLDRLIKSHYPKLHETLSSLKIDCLFFAAPWFITLFCNTLPCAYALRILEIYLVEGEKILYRVALQILKIKKKKVKQMNQFDLIMAELTNFEALSVQKTDIDDFFFEMFGKQLSRKDLDRYNEEFAKKQQPQSPM